MSKKIFAGVTAAALAAGFAAPAFAATPDYEAAYAEATACMNQVMASPAAQNEAEWGGVEPHTPAWEAKLVEIVNRECAASFAKLDKVKKADDFTEAASVPGAHLVPGEQPTPAAEPKAGELSALSGLNEKEAADFVDSVFKGDQKSLDKVGMAKKAPKLSNNQLSGELVNAAINAEKAYKAACKVDEKGVPTVQLSGKCGEARDAYLAARDKVVAFGNAHNNEPGGAAYDPSIDPAKVKNLGKGLTAEEAKKLADGKKADVKADVKADGKKADVKADGKKADGKKASGKLAKTGATVGVLGALAALTAVAGGAVVALRKRA